MNASRYNLVFYDDEILMTFIMNLTRSKGKNISAVKYAYIKHDSDIEIETGQPKKLHFHLWLEFPSQVKSRDIENILQLSGSSISALSYEKTDRNFLAYLTHDNKNNALKAHYDFKDIITNIDETEFSFMYDTAVQKMSKPSKAQVSFNAVQELAFLIESNDDIIDISSLIYFLIENNLIDLMDYVQKKTYFVKLAFEKAFRYNSMKKASSSLKSRFNEKLDEANKELKQLEKYNDDLQQRIDQIEIIQTAIERDKK